MVDLEKAKVEMVELKNKLAALEKECSELKETLKKKTGGLCQTTTLELLGIPANADIKQLIKDVPEVLKERIVEQENCLIRLALAGAVGLTSVYDMGHTCCPDDDPRPYLEKTEELKIRELVSRVDNGWAIKEEKFDEARDLLICSFSKEEAAKEYSSLKEQLEKTEQEIEFATYEKDELGKEIKLAELIHGDQISEKMREHLLEAVNGRGFGGLHVVNPDTAVYHTSRSEWGSSGGIAYFDQANVYYKGQVKQQEWQWRDRYDPDKDRHDLRFSEFRQVQIQEGTDEVMIRVELLNNEYGSRWATFIFEPAKEMPSIKTLSEEEQQVFSAKIETEAEKIRAEKMRLWECKPQMLARYPATAFMPMPGSGYEPYRRPSLKKTVHISLGIAAFLVEEQIDHRGSDPQIRYELYFLRYGDDKPLLVAEDHGYEREGGALLNLIHFDQNTITFSVGSSDNKQTFNLR